MPRTNLNAILIPTGYAVAPQAITWTAADVANGNDFTLTGDEIILIRNVSATTAQTVTIASTPLNGRTGDITAFSLPLGTFYVTQRFPTSGWAQSTGKLNINGGHVDIQFAVIRIRQ